MQSDFITVILIAILSIAVCLLVSVLLQRRSQHRSWASRYDKRRLQRARRRPGLLALLVLIGFVGLIWIETAFLKWTIMEPQGPAVFHGVPEQASEKVAVAPSVPAAPSADEPPTPTVTALRQTLAVSGDSGTDQPPVPSPTARPTRAQKASVPLRPSPLPVPSSVPSQVTPIPTTIVASDAAVPPAGQESDPASKPSGSASPVRIIALKGDVDQARPYSIILGSYRSKRNAQLQVDAYGRRGLAAYWTKVDIKQKGIWFRFFCGVFSDMASARRYIDIHQLKYADVRKTPYTIIVDISDSRTAVEKQHQKILAAGWSAYIIATADGRYRLCVGAYSTRSGAASFLAEFKKTGLDGRVALR